MVVDMQPVFLLLVQWHLEIVDTEQFLHLRRWSLGNEGYNYLYLSSAAWSPSRAAMVRVAMRLFVLDLRRDLVLHDRLGSQMMRRLRRAVGATGLPVAAGEDVVQWVRRLAREYRVERAAALAARGGDDGAAVGRMRRILDGVIREDVDSTSSSEEEQ